MKLKPADIDRILEDNVPKPTGMVQAHDFTAENEAAREALLQGLIAQTSQSVARHGTTLPPPPKSLVTHIDGPNDFGAKLTTRLSALNSGSNSNTSNQQSPSAINGGEGLEIDGEVLERSESGSQLPLPPALRGGDLDKIQCRADLIRLLCENIPLNDLGLPKIIYRADLIDWRLFQGFTPLGTDPAPRYKEMQDYLDVATIYLSYAEGFPALPTGEPLWARMPFETDEQYAAFTDYCVIPGARQVVKVQGYLTDQLIAWYHENYWAIRVQCYDMLNTVHAAKVREQRLLACEDDHYLKAEKMLQKLNEEMAHINWESLRADPKAFVDVMDKVVKLQRVALGQGSQATERKELKSESIEVTMRKLATPNVIEKAGKDGGIDVRTLLRNPDALSSAQELIIKMTRQVTSTSTSNSTMDPVNPTAAEEDQ